MQKTVQSNLNAKTYQVSSRTAEGARGLCKMREPAQSIQGQRAAHLIEPLTTSHSKGHSNSRAKTETTGKSTTPKPEDSRYLHHQIPKPHCQASRHTQSGKVQCRNQKTAVASIIKLQEGMMITDSQAKNSSMTSKRDTEAHHAGRTAPTHKPLDKKSNRRRHEHYRKRGLLPFWSCQFLDTVRELKPAFRQHRLIALQHLLGHQGDL